ncbi:MAG TPA: DUF397 domain-containing protein [Mycobacteriales bacterium]|nr:DUF397 domain-containing protein [Mycobacteriales bacterium]
MRDSKRPDGTPLAFDSAEFTAFLTAVRAGTFDTPG